MRPFTYHCDQRWSDLTPTGDGRRFCAACGNDVHDLSGMTRREATRFREDNPGACIRVRVRTGTEELVFVPEPPTRKLALPIVVAASLALGCAEEEPLARVTPEAIEPDGVDIAPFPTVEERAPSQEPPSQRAEPRTVEALEPSAEPADGLAASAAPATRPRSNRVRAAERNERHRANGTDEDRTVASHAATHAFPALVTPSTLDAPQPIREPRPISSEVMGF